MTERVDVVVIGAGVVGLAVARCLALAGREVLVLERHDAIGTETSSRNSEVIHAGIYYPTGSNKARLCVRGKHLLYAYCAKAGVPHANCGKVIVAVRDDDVSRLDAYREQAAINGAGDLTALSGVQVRQLEPEVRAVAGLLSPTTGIIDSHSYMLALQGELEAAGGWVAFLTEVVGLEATDDGIDVHTEAMSLRASWVVNAAGLSAPGVAGWMGVAPKAHYARGRYYALTGPQPFKRLVYPLPEPGGLGVHVTLDLAGQAKFGPDVEWLDTVDYTFDDSAREAFVAAIASYYPGIDADRLHPSYTGVRPKISGPDEANADFVLAGPAQHGTPGLVNLLGIESPGLTASLAIGEAVEAMICP